MDTGPGTRLAATWATSAAVSSWDTHAITARIEALIIAFIVGSHCVRL